MDDSGGSAARGSGSTPAADETVRVDWRDRVIVVTMHRPDRRNAVNLAMLSRLLEVQHEARDGGARVMVLTGTAPAFCAGADLAEVEDDAFVGALSEVLRGFVSLPLLTVAAVDGPALGAGTQLAIACDLRVATAPSAFGVPAARLGLAVDTWTVRRLAAEMGDSVARGMLLAAETYSGEHLRQVGAVHRIGDLAKALTWATELAELAPLTVRAHKLAIEHGEAPAVAPEVEAARRAAWDSADVREGKAAFREKRPPRFRGE